MAMPVLLASSPGLVSVQRSPLGTRPSRCVLPACQASFLKPLSVSSRLNTKRCVQHRRNLQVRAEAAPGGQVMDKDWEEAVLKSAIPVLVDFWAPWCGPCRMVEPTVDELAVEYGEKLKVLKLNTDLNPATASAYGIRSIPTVMLFKDGKKKESVIGAVPKATLVQMLEKYIDN